MVYMSGKCVVGRVGLGYSIHCLEEDMVPETEMTKQLQLPVHA